MTESKSFNRVATIILTILVIIAMLPILLIVIASFSAESSLIRNGYTYWPEQWSLDAYYYMVKQSIMILRSYGVSFLVTFVGTALSVIITTMLAYPMSRKSFKYRNALAFFVFLQCYLMVVLYRLTLCGQNFSISKYDLGIDHSELSGKCI